MELRREIKGNIPLQAAFRKAPKIAQEEMTRATWESELLFQREAQEETPAGIGAGGGLRGSISAREPIVLADTVLGMVGSPLNYAVPVEIGSKPHMPPVQPLIDWAEHKLGADPAEAIGIGFAVARKIKKHGTEGVHMFEKALDRTAPQIERIYQRGGQRIVNRMAEGGR